MKYYRVMEWEKRFESYKSKGYKRKSQTYLPNKVGIGYIRIMREHDGAAIYGAWCAMVAMLSRQEAPRLGVLTDTGRTTGTALDVESISLLTMIHPEIIARMLSICSSQSVGWLKVEWRTDPVRDTTGAAQGDLGLHSGDAQKGEVQTESRSVSATYDSHGDRPLPLPLPLPSKTTPGSPPSLSEVVAYGATVGMSEQDSEEFHEFWKAAEWTDRRGTPVHARWKPLMLSRKSFLAEKRLTRGGGRNGQRVTQNRAASANFRDGQHDDAF